MIQAAWRAAIDRVEAAERARRKLRAVLVDLGGGQGRMHRYVGCGRILSDIIHFHMHTFEDNLRVGHVVKVAWKDGWF